ncbi:hypothetical protein N7495_005816 [Penicillium taxi]|uniref:uncharacterized protein n=1 Tax=Penicillium taxi TaxID=168475 RepID=UPI002544F665|nr:uncharacterized protein N7495_005816 [Penicillium taxi]KAJ5894125.1 hypothetical protein N7495_005816 [Penicillium taxi]
MSDVEAVSLPAALDVGSNPLSVLKEHPSELSALTHGNPAQPARSSHDLDTGALDDDGQGPPSPKADSEAETIIQSGRESLSPEKKRKHIRHDPNRQGFDSVDGSLSKKPRINADRRHSRSRSPISSERAKSPPSAVKIEVDDPESVTRDLLKRNGTSEHSKPQIYRKRSFSDSVDEKGDRHIDSRLGVTPDLKQNNHLSRPISNARSISPTRSSHQRSVSGSHIISKKRVPTPFLTAGFQRQASEDRLSTSSSASGSPLPSLQLRKLGSGIGASASPAKHLGPKKLRDKSGRTPLARACADRKYDQVIIRHSERPEDLNVPDNAGNTPLQIASLSGEAPIVKFLLDAGCEINSKNIDKDTPLIDAVENGNVEVVKLLLEAGANPRTVNASGDEPYELVPQDLDDDEYREIRKALADAKASSRPNRRSEEQIGPHIRASSRRASAASPSRSPPPLGSVVSRRKTGRSEATRNDLLWTQPTSEKLRDFAAKGDEQGVVSILNILQKADDASLIAAAKGGHHDVLSLMYAMGDADADPNPVRGGGHKPGYNTPMLAAIGRGNTAVIKLILNQPGFNPTRRLFENRTYYELSRSRQGENWEEEYAVLKAAYENFSGSDKAKNSPRRARIKDKDEKRKARRESSSPVPRSKKLDDSHRLPRDVDSLKEKRREKVKEKEKVVPRAQGITRDASDNALASSDHDSSQNVKSKKSASSRRGSESSGVARTDEVRKRRLIAGRRPQEQNRRPSLFSSDSMSGREEAPKSRPETSPDNSSLKRLRPDNSPERSRSRGTDSDRLSPSSRKKKRRVLQDETSSNLANSSRKNNEHVDGDKKPRPQEDSLRSAYAVTRKPAQTSKESTPSRPSINSDSIKKNEDVKVEQSEPPTKPVAEVTVDDKQAELAAEKLQRDEAKKAEKDRVAEEKRLAEEAESARLAKEEADRAACEKVEEDERKRKEVEEKRAKLAEDERLKRAEQERLRKSKMRRDQEAQERRRRDALPGRLRVAAHLVGSQEHRAKSHEWLKNFMPLVTATTRQLQGRQLQVNGFDETADERWIPNYLVAPLLATNDLQLSQYASWEKRNATATQRMNLWRCSRRMLVYTDDPKYSDASFGDIMQLNCETRPKYFEMEHIFWIRLSDFMDLVPHIPHLNGLDLEFVSMHIDPEPSQPNGQPHLNGYTPAYIETNGSGMNGHGYSRPNFSTSIPNMAYNKENRPAQELSALAQLIESTSTESPLAATTVQVLHNLQHQHNWTSLQTHDISSHASEISPSTLSASIAVQTIISGIPPNRIYTHPDEQLYMLEKGLREEDLRPERLFVLPTAQGQSWSLRQMAGVFDSLGDIHILTEDESVSAAADASTEAENEAEAVNEAKEKLLEEFYVRKENAKLEKEWGSQRVLLAMVDKAMGGEGTVVYYVVQEGEVKPRQN